MAQQAQGATPPNALQVVLRGLISDVVKRVGKDGDSFRTILKTPAVDPYSSPCTYEVRSKARLGSKGQEIEATCELVGYGRSYENKDGDTVRTAEHVLQVV